MSVYVATTDQQFVYLPATNVEISLIPVIRAKDPRNGRAKLSERAAASPVTDISASEASAVAARMGGRLPSHEEIAEFVHVMRRAGEDLSEISPSMEWLNCSPEWDTQDAKMKCIASIDSASVKDGAFIQGSLQDRRYAFVTFRIVRSPQTRKLRQS